MLCIYMRGSHVEDIFTNINSLILNIILNGKPSCHYVLASLIAGQLNVTKLIWIRAIH
jgi:hypothetical protein